MKKEQTMASRAGLKARGWTDALVTRFLGEPDELVPNPHYKSAAPMRLYYLDRVVIAETTDDFKAAQVKAKARSDTGKAVADAKRVETMRQIDAFEFKVPLLEKEALIDRACHHYNRLWRDRGEYDKAASPASDPTFLERITVNYLRHACSKYERQLERQFGKIGADDARLAVKKKVLATIAEQYPDLATECHRQAERADFEFGWRRSVLAPPSILAQCAV